MKQKKTGAFSPRVNEPPLNHEQEKIRLWLQKVRFRKCLFGGVLESDVWKKIGELDALYEAALSAERARYDGLLEAQRKNCDGGDAVEKF